MRKNWQATARVKNKIKGGSTGATIARPNTVSAVGAVATISASARGSSSVSGAPATGSSGTLFVALGVFLESAGVFGTGEVGTTTASGKANTGTVGTQAGGFAGQAQAEGTLTNNASASVTTVDATSALGSVAPQGKANVPAGGSSEAIGETAICLGNDQQALLSRRLFKTQGVHPQQAHAHPGSGADRGDHEAQPIW